jgi:hypothetical protein
VNQFVAELRKLAKDCGFGNSLNTMLCDRLVVGVRDSAVQKKFLSETDDLSFARALEIAQAMEGANKQVKRMAEEKQENTGATASVTATVELVYSKKTQKRESPYSASRES